MKILKTEDLKKYYGNKENEVHALNGVNFYVEEGEFVSIVGTSGSGKSTLLKNVTSDYHYHTVTAEEERILDDVEVELAKRGYLVEQKKEELQ